MIILWNMDLYEGRKSLALLCLMEKATPRYIALEDLDKPLGTLAGNSLTASPAFSGASAASPLSPASSAASGSCMPADTSSSLEMTLCGEPVMVFAGMSPQAVSRFLDRMKEMGLPPISLKAVLTPTSAGWTMPRLAQELMKERKALS